MPDQFEEDLIDDLFKDLEHKKTKHPYVEPQVQHAATIETETKNTNDEFFGLQQMLNEVNDAATEQKKQKQNEVVTLFVDIIDEDNLFNNIKTDDIYIEDGLFDNNDSQDIKNISSDAIETIDLSDDIEIPSDNELANDAPKRIKINTHPNRTRLESRRTLKKYQRQQQNGNLKKTNKKASKRLKKAGYLGTEDLETIDYNNDTLMDNLETVDFNNDTEMIDLVDLKK